MTLLAHRSPSAPCVRLLALVLSFLFTLPSAFAAKATFDIPPQPAAAALKLFMKQSGAQVVFSNDKLQGVLANEVRGEMEPSDALAKLLAGTGFEATQSGVGNFVVDRVKPATTAGSLRGSLTGEGGKGVADVLVSIRETAQSTSTDRYGVYFFPNVATGTYVLVASAPGYQTMHITDVVVKAGRELTLGKEDMRKAQEGVLALDPFVVHADAVTELEKFEVTGSKQKPFEGANVDIPRTVNDVQPYYIFDSKSIDQSGAVNVEDFLKQRLTMNATAMTNGQSSQSNLYGNTSSVNLRGLGTAETLILVNGRRVAGVSINGNSFQPDLNGIPVSAIDHIEVLPSSASGIYGGGAIGGVVNVVLKRKYSGGELRVTYDNTWGTDAPTRNVALNYGFSTRDGKTQVMLHLQWADAKPLLLQDRRIFMDRGLETILRNQPGFLYTDFNPFLGALPNFSGPFGNLVLKDGTPVGSRRTFLGAGISSATTAADLKASLLANTGKWDFNLPASTQSPTGLLRAFGVTPENKSYLATLRRELSRNLDLQFDVSEYDSSTKSTSNPFGSLVIFAPATIPTNPFSTAVIMRYPSASDVPRRNNASTQSFTTAILAHLPADWTGEVDYSWSKSVFRYSFYQVDTTTFNQDLRSGAINPFVDTLAYPLKLEKYLYPVSSLNRSTLAGLTTRAAGPLPSLPWGQPNLVLGAEHRVAKIPGSVIDYNNTLTPSTSQRYTYFGQSETTGSLYAETLVPLAKRDVLPWLHDLEAQLAGRGEFFRVTSGTPYSITNINQVPPTTSYGEPTLNGQPFSAKTNYSSSNYTAGIKYQPTPDLTFRISRASAFLPPTPSQLLQNPKPDDFPSTIIDPRTGNSYDVTTVSGGNANLNPQTSKSFNAGLIWERKSGILKGLRLNAEYYQIDQYSAIGSLDAQTIISQAVLFPGRVTRDTNGLITLVDTSLLNLFVLKTKGIDLSFDYERNTALGRVSLHGTGSMINSIQTQYALNTPAYESVGFPAEGGAAKYKANISMGWERSGWMAGWTTRYFGSYMQFGAAGGPSSTQFYNGGQSTDAYIPAQGSDTIPSQIYHDAFVGYDVMAKSAGYSSGKAGLVERVKSGWSIQAGVRNIFGALPPTDVFWSSNFYISPYGDTRLRSYWITVRKQF